MKLLLACTFLLAATYVSADNIDCLYCYEGDPELYLVVASLNTVGLDLPKDKCADNVNDTAKQSVDPTKLLCTKIDLSATISENDYSLVIRTTAADGKCDSYQTEIDKLDDGSDAAKAADIDFECNQCDEDKCNSAGSIQMSLLLLVSSLMVYFMRS